jgi:hypothetical protein
MNTIPFTPPLPHRTTIGKSSILIIYSPTPPLPYSLPHSPLRQEVS